MANLTELDLYIGRVARNFHFAGIIVGFLIGLLF
jgi:hypothetical protein